MREQGLVNVLGHGVIVEARGPGAAVSSTPPAHELGAKFTQCQLDQAVNSSGLGAAGSSAPLRGLGHASTAMTVGKQQVRLSQAHFEGQGNDYSQAKEHNRLPL